MKKSYYIDSCIYLNLWKKEVDEKEAPLWRFVKDFLQRIENEGSIIYYSGYLLKELSFILDKETFNQKLKMFNYYSGFIRVNLSLEEFNEARRIESETNHEISFYDIIHMLSAKKTNSILITRDKKLIKICKKYNIPAKLPEELL